MATPPHEHQRDEAAGSASPATRIDSALHRLLCALALSPEAEAQGDEPWARASRGAAADLASLVAALAMPHFDRLMAEVVYADDLATASAALTAFAEAWTTWQATARGTEEQTVMQEPTPVPLAQSPAGVTPAPAGARRRARIDDDVEALQGDPEMAGMFIAEALDHLGTIEASVLQLEAAPGDAKLLNDIFRPFHTVKGNAGALGVSTVQELAHKVENLLDLCRSGRHVFGPSETDAALEAVDVLSALARDLQTRLAGQPGTDLEPRRQALMAVVEGLVTGTSAAAPPSAPPPAAAAVHAVALTTEPAGRDRAPADHAPSGPPLRRADDAAAQASVKVDTRKLDNLIDMVGELVIAQAILQEDPALLRVVDDRVSRNLAQLKRITSDLQRTAMSMRMVPIRQTFQKMARLVRDLSKKSGKTVNFVLTGEDTELDRRVVEDINDPLMHMVRNSMDHGIEDGARRTQSGKGAEGRLSLSAYHQGGNIVIAIQDDGAGLDTEKILAKAVAQGLVSADTPPAAADIHQLIFQPGFSTADTVTEISGRGVGMDVVRRNIEALRGRIEIQSVTGQGTTFLIKLPLTLAIIDGLVLGVGGERFVMPTFSVCESLRPTPEQVHTVRGVPCMIQVRGQLLPLIRLADVCRVDAREHDVCRATVVVLEDDGHRVGLVVDELLGKQEVVIKSLGESFGQVAGVAGGAILGDGRVGLILDAHGIVSRARQDHSRAA